MGIMVKTKKYVEEKLEDHFAARYRVQSIIQPMSYTNGPDVKMKGFRDSPQYKQVHISAHILLLLKQVSLAFN